MSRVLGLRLDLGCGCFPELLAADFLAEVDLVLDHAADEVDE